jgi:hydrogenase nickel incorporation protein HypA/HybF
MDERELANYVLGVVDQAAYRNAVAHVAAVRLAIGGRRVIDIQRLNRTFEEVTHGTVAEGARLDVQVLPVTHHCRACGTNFPGTADDTPCPRCGHPHTEQVGGEEIRVLGMDVDEAP